MPRDNDKNNGRPPRRAGGAGAGGGKGRPGGGARGAGSRGGAGPRSGERPARSSAPRGDKKFGERKFGDKKFGDKKPYAARSGDKPYAGKRESFGKGEGFRKDGERGAARPRFNRDDRPQREDRGEGRTFKPRKEFGDRSADARGGEKRSFRPRDDRGEGRSFKPREDRPFKPREDRGGDRPFKARSRDDRAPREDRGERRSFKPREDRGDRPFRARSGDERPARAPRRDFARGEDRSNDKPWEDRKPRGRDERGGDRPRFSRDRDDRAPRADRAPRNFDRPREDRERSGFGRPRFDKPREERSSRPAHRTEWQEHPRSEGRGRFSRDDRPRRDNEDDSKIFAKRPAFGGRGAYRERSDDDRRAPRAAPAKTKTGERIAKVVARAGLCSRRDAEEWITQGRVAVNGRVINSPALDVTSRDVITIDGQPLPERERTRLFLYHKPRGLMTTHDDPEGRPTVFDNLPEGLPRLISIGRLDFNTEGLLLLTNDGGLARALEHPDTGWLRRYRVRAHGEVTQAQLDQLKNGVEVDGVKYGSIDATLERDQGANVWVTFAIREGKNREVRNVMAHLGLEVNRLIRISYGPFQLGEIAEGQAEEVKSRVLRDQLGEKIVEVSGALFAKPAREVAEEAEAKKTKRSVVADRKGRRVLVQRTGSDEARERNEYESSGYGAPRRPKRGYHGKRDFTPKD
ncbi:pseudouridine synthase [Afipia sp. TerB]